MVLPGLANRKMEETAHFSHSSMNTSNQTKPLGFLNTNYILRTQKTMRTIPYHIHKKTKLCPIKYFCLTHIIHEYGGAMNEKVVGGQW